MRDIRKEIRENLDAIEKKYDVKILLAVESGSRAWGFASPDSDYDVRFIYVHRPEEYLRIDTMKDVIEWQLDEVLDINGWDLRKALLAFGKGNPNVMEWTNSPIIYRQTPFLIYLEMVESAAACFEKWHGNVRFSAETRENRKVIKRTLRHADVLMACVRVFSEY